MIESIIASLEDVFNQMDWVQKYGGLVETWTRKGKGEGDVDIVETFPVTWGTSPNCGDSCLGLLLPDGNKKNVLFWTVETDAQVAPAANISRAMKASQFTQNARLNVWLNFTGCDACDASSYIAYVEYLRQALNGKKFALTSPLSIRGKLSVTAVPTKDFREVFGRWTFVGDERFFVYPFDFFALDITFTWIQNQSCPILPTC